MKAKFSFLIFLFRLSVSYAQVDTLHQTISHSDSTARPQPFQYDKDAGFRCKSRDFTWTTWAFAERLFAGKRAAAWRRVTQGMEIKFPAYNFRINGNKFRTALVYEVDFTDNNFLKPVSDLRFGKTCLLVFKMPRMQISSEYYLARIPAFFQEKIIFPRGTCLP